MKTTTVAKIMYSEIENKKKTHLKGNENFKKKKKRQIQKKLISIFFNTVRISLYAKFDKIWIFTKQSLSCLTKKAPQEIKFLYFFFVSVPSFVCYNKKSNNNKKNSNTQNRGIYARKKHFATKDNKQSSECNAQ